MREEGKKLHPLVELAKETVEHYIQEGKVFQPRKIHPEITERAGVFVSLKKRGELRGCIGTFHPTKETIVDEIVANAVNSATKDPRFPPVQVAELPDLEYTVDVLSQPECIESEASLDPKKYGVIVESEWSRGLLLPDLEGVDTAQLQIEICRRKAGIMPDDPITLYRFVVRRYT